MTKLTQKAQSCEFGEYAVAVDEQIRDQVINHCSSHNIRRKLLEKGFNFDISATERNRSRYGRFWENRLARLKVQLTKWTVLVWIDHKNIGGLRGGAKEAAAPLFFLYFQNVFCTTPNPCNRPLSVVIIIPGFNFIQFRSFPYLKHILC